jgi:hypothetical protein
MVEEDITMKLCGRLAEIEKASFHLLAELHESGRRLCECS